MRHKYIGELGKFLGSVIDRIPGFMITQIRNSIDFQRAACRYLTLFSILIVKLNIIPRAALEEVQLGRSHQKPRFSF